MINIDKELINLISQLAKLVGVLDDIKFRDRLIQIEFEEIKLNEPHLTIDEIINKLKDKYYLSEESIKKIIYNKENSIIEITPKIRISKKRRLEPRRRN